MGTWGARKGVNDGAANVQANELRTSKNMLPLADSSLNRRLPKTAQLACTLPVGSYHARFLGYPTLSLKMPKSQMKKPNKGYGNPEVDRIRGI